MPTEENINFFAIYRIKVGSKIDFWVGFWFIGYYSISTFVGYLTPNPFLCK